MGDAVLYRWVLRQWGRLKVWDAGVRGSMKKRASGTYAEGEVFANGGWGCVRDIVCVEMLEVEI